MPPPIPKREIRSKLTSKFGFEKTGRDDHEEFVLTINGKIVAKTYFSHSSRSNEVGAALIASMAKQLHVRSGEFARMVNCTISRDQYLTMITE